MADKTWKKRERQVAKFFASLRTPLSSGNSRHTRSDTLHPHLFIEHKHRKTHALLSLWRKVKELADKENKIPVVSISEHGRKGFWLVIKSSDFDAVVNQRVNAIKKPGV